MKQKPIAISVIASLAAAGILTLCPLATKPLANHAFAATACSLTLKADPGSGVFGGTANIEQKLSGTLSCGGTGLGGAYVLVYFPGGIHSPGSQTLITESSGNFGGPRGPSFVMHPGGSADVSAHFKGNSEHSAAEAAITIHTSTK